MTTSEFLLTANGLLLALVGYFLKYLHNKLAQLLWRVNHLETELDTEATTSRMHRDQTAKEMDRLTKRVNRIETFLLNRQF